MRHYLNRIDNPCKSLCRSLQVPLRENRRKTFKNVNFFLFWSDLASLQMVKTSLRELPRNRRGAFASLVDGI